MGCLNSKPQGVPAAPSASQASPQPSQARPVAAQTNGTSPPGPSHVATKAELPAAPAAAASSSSIPAPPPPQQQTQIALPSSRDPNGSIKPPPYKVSGSGAPHPKSFNTQNAPQPPAAKERRAAAGSEAVRDHIRKMVVGGPQTREEQQNVYEVSDSEDEDLEADEGTLEERIPKPPDVSDALCEALKRNFVFKGIPEQLLSEVVDRMFGVSFKSGSTVLQQGAVPKPEDCMYYLQLGEAEVVITGAVGEDQPGSQADQEDRTVEGHTVRIAQKPGWIFGDVALLFNSPRTASVVAKTNITVWSLDRRTFLKFVMKHAQGARALRFLRKLPLLKGLDDHLLIKAAVRMPQRKYQDGQALIKYGERGDEMFLIRYGKVRVLVPRKEGGHLEVAVLGRGQFVGERSLINNRLRSADCVAQGTVQVVVMKKRDFMNLDNPLLAWMLDYDAVATVIKSLPLLKDLKQEQMEHLLDKFDAREEKHMGDVIAKQGDMVERLTVVKLGEVQLVRDGQVVQDPSFLREQGGFNFFGGEALDGPFVSKYTVTVVSETLHMLCLHKGQLDSFLVQDSRPSGSGLGEQLKALKASHPVLQSMSDADLKARLQFLGERNYMPGEVIVKAPQVLPSMLFLVRSGEVVLVAPDFQLPGEVKLALLGPSERGRIAAGGLLNTGVLATAQTASQQFTLVAAKPDTLITAFSLMDRAAAQRADGQASGASTSSGAAAGGGGAGRSASPRDVALSVQGGGMVGSDPSRPRVQYQDLEFHRIIGTGQFGLVRVTRNTKTNEVYALKVMHKAPIVESKQFEHVINERRILEEASHPFCVRLVAAFQDKLCLYLLQEWVPGGELFHHLELQGKFDEPTAMFYAASVLLALEFLHNKGIVYRDLKPENLLLDTNGYIKMADFGFAKRIRDDKTYTICGTPDYQAPEVIMRRGTSKAADYWALGVLIFEMLVGDPPFKSLTGDPWDTFRKTLSGRFVVPKFISPDAQDLIFRLLQVNPERRMGSGPDGANDIKRHRWFSRIDWTALEQKRLPAPIRPRIRNPLDTSHFDNFDDCDVEPPQVPPERANRHNTVWELWEWVDGGGQ